MLLKLITLIFLLIIFWEDMQSRSVHWYLFPLLALALAGVRYQHGINLNDWTGLILINLAFLLIQFVLVTLYFSLKKKRFTVLMAGLLGWGDVLLLICLACYYSPGNFLVFYIISLVIVLLGWLMYLYFSNQQKGTIPLAGLQAALCFIAFIISWWGERFDLTSDAGFIQFLVI